MAIRRCASCSRFLPAIAGRGRPSLRCDRCKPAKVINIRSCRSCDVVLPAPVGRGRPPVNCVACRIETAPLVVA